MNFWKESKLNSTIMEERILVYKDEAKYSDYARYYKTWVNNLQ